MLLCLAATWAFAQPHPDDLYEEIVVYAERGAWDDTRWHVRSDQRVTGVLRLDHDAQPIEVDAWQLDWVLACELIGPRRASCEVEAAALRVVAAPSFPAPHVAEAVDHVVARLEAMTVQVAFDGHGELTQVDAVGLGSGNGLDRALEMALRPMAGVHRPEGALDDDATWWRPRDRLLRLPGYPGNHQLGHVNHFGNHYRGQYVVQTIGRATTSKTQAYDLQIVPPALLPPAYASGERTLADGASVSIRGGAQLTGVAIYDLDTAVLQERVFSVNGYPSSYWHAGRVRKLEVGEAVDVGHSGQVAPVGEEVGGLPSWPLDEVGAPLDLAWR